MRCHSKFGSWHFFVLNVVPVSFTVLALFLEPEWLVAMRQRCGPVLAQGTVIESGNAIFNETIITYSSKVAEIWSTESCEALELLQVNASPDKLTG